MYCRKCGSELSEDTKFCPKCGTQIVVSDNNESEEIKKKPYWLWGILILVLLIAIIFVFKKSDNVEEEAYNEVEISTMYENEFSSVEETTIQEAIIQETIIQETEPPAEIKEEGITATYIEAGYCISQFEIIDNYLYVTTESTFINTDINSICFEVSPNCEWYSYFTSGERGDTLSYDIIKADIDETHAHYAADRENYITDSATNYAIEVENGVIVAVYSINS